jgi:hypothetical protein
LRGVVEHPDREPHWRFACGRGSLHELL